MMKNILKFINLFIVCMLLLCLWVNVYAAEKGLALYLNFDEGEGNIAHDISGNENHGDINRTEWIKEGKYGSAMQFDGGPESYIRIKKSDSLIPDDKVTLEAWVFPTKVEGNNNIISNTEGSGHNIRFENGKLISYIHVGAAYVTPTGGPDIVPEKWYHTAVTFDGKVANLYLNGELIGQAEQSGKITESTQDLFVGSETDGNNPNQTYAFFGIIDEVRIWHVVRTENEIKAAKEGPLSLSITPKAFLTTYWGKIKQE